MEAIANYFSSMNLNFGIFLKATGMLLVALLALLATIIFVRKEKELKYTAIDVVSIVFNFIIGIAHMGFVTILALLIDIH